MTRTRSKIVAAALLGAAFLVGPAATSASADAYGCHGKVCVDVPGHGHYIGKVTIYYNLGPRVADSGTYLFKVNGKVVHRSNFHKYHNESYFHSHQWSSFYTFDRNLTKGDRVCGEFDSMKYSDDTACETVG